MDIYIIFRDGQPVVTSENMCLFESKQTAEWFLNILARDRAKKVLSEWSIDWLNPMNADTYKSVTEEESKLYTIKTFRQVE